MSFREQLSEKIKNLITSSRLDEALDEFRSITKGSHLENEILQQLARLSVLKEAERSGTLTHEDKKIDFAQINYSTLELLNDWQKSKENEQEAFRTLLPEDILYPDTPFKGLNFYTRKDALIFYGRSKTIGELISTLENNKLARIILLHGQSGVGKSSLLNAGLLPCIEEKYTISSLLRHEKKGWLPAIDEWEKKLDNTFSKPPLLTLDQSEEIFTKPIQGNEKKKLAYFLKSWLAAYPNGRVIISFRKEYLAEILDLLKQEQLNSEKKYVKPLNKREIYEVVYGPMEDKIALDKYQFSIEHEVIDQLVLEIGKDKESHIAPALQLLLTQLWKAANEEAEDKGESNLIVDEKLYKKVSSPGVLLANYLDEEINKLRNNHAHAEMVSSGIVWDMLEYLITEFNTTKRRTQNELQKLFDHVLGIDNLLAVLKDSYLILVIDSKKSGKFYRLAHDSLAPLIKQRYNESNAPGQLARRILESRTREHKAFQEYLLSEKDLEILKDGKKGMRSYSKDNTDLIAKSIAAIEQRKKKIRKKNNNNRNRILFLLGVIILVSIFFYQYSVETQKRQSLTTLNSAKTKLFNFSAGNEEQEKKINAEYSQIIKWGYHKDSVLVHFGDFVGSYILKRNHKAILPILDLIESFTVEKKFESQLNKINSELCFILLFANRVEKENQFLEKYIPDISSKNIKQNPQLVKSLYVNKFGGELFGTYCEKYLPVMVQLKNLDSSYTFICSMYNKGSIKENFALSKTEITLTQFSFLANCLAESIGLSNSNIKEKLNMNQYKSIDSFSFSLTPNAKEVFNPVITSGNMAIDFAKWFGGQLPSTSEYEYIIVSGIDFSSNNENRLNNNEEPYSVLSYSSSLLGIQGLITNSGEWCRNKDTSQTNQYVFDNPNKISKREDDMCFILPVNPIYNKNFGFRLRFAPNNPWLEILSER